MQPLERTYVDCQCDNVFHTIRFTYDPDDGLFMVEMHVVNYLPWYKRMYIGFKYMLGLDGSPKYDLSIIDPKDYNTISKLLDSAKAFQVK